MANSGKFDGVDFCKLDIELLTPELRQLGQGFRCVRGEFVTYWKQGRIQREVDSYLCQCWMVRVEDALAGYITLLADKLQVEDALLARESVKYRTFPAIKIGLLAVDRRTKGLGVRLVEWAIDYVITEVVPVVGVRFITVDALYDADVEPTYDASGFYVKLGFEFADPTEPLPPINPYLTMYLDLKPLIEVLAIEEMDEDWI
ncbi:MAG: GNAT family N-acetyltransferase [Nostoc sp.]|uniref:GNAT family N-acetyltransferase n=1 Tax=unclassified Nostoc TaxID=2593658 RepID=UPI0025E30679|nr:GNAT family N-acetyltransferase [Nostoc sp. NMS9]MBN3938397.1 GNAT family N-acetyltransferase [Nostoc sp. NMS9]